jgi:RNA polymerase sigma-70 factor (ECF subfamily)
MTALPAPASQASPLDCDLVAAVGRGDLQALGELFERHEPLVRRYFGRLGIAPGDVDDVVQAVFLEVMRAAERYESQYGVRSWLCGIATIMARRHHRGLGRLASRMAAWAGVDAEAAIPTPCEIVEHDQVARILQRAIEGLSDKKREVFVLVTLEGLSGEEAARALGIPLKTVWTRLHYARCELRAVLEQSA